MRLLALASVISLLSAAAPVLAEEGSTIATIREGLRGHLKDATSAEIRVTKDVGHQVVASKVGKPQVGRVICAQVNAKNGYGAYIGERPFMFILRDDGQLSIWERTGMYADDVPVYEARCGA